MEPLEVNSRNFLCSTKQVLVNIQIIHNLFALYLYSEQKLVAIWSQNQF